MANTEYRDKFDPKLLERAESALQQGVDSASICRRLPLRADELRDLFPDYFDDTPEPERNATSGY